MTTAREVYSRIKVSPAGTSQVATPAGRFSFVADAVTPPQGDGTSETRDVAVKAARIGSANVSTTEPAAAQAVLEVVGEGG